LKQDEKLLYARLGVFVGGFTLEAAEAVCNPGGRLDILEGLTSPLNNSLLRHEDVAGGESRFGMLDTIRSYALERLRESGEMAALQQQHTRYFGGVILNQAASQLFSAKALYWLNWLEREHDNVRVLLTWTRTAPPGVELAASLVRAFNWFWYRRGHFSEGRMWAERVLASPEITDPGQARAWLDQAYVEARAIGESWVLASALTNLGEVARTQGRYSEARTYCEESEALLRSSGDTGDLARLVHNLGISRSTKEITHGLPLNSGRVLQCSAVWAIRGGSPNAWRGWPVWPRGKGSQGGGRPCSAQRTFCSGRPAAPGGRPIVWRWDAIRRSSAPRWVRWTMRRPGIKDTT
jgi:hypothetical protein